MRNKHTSPRIQIILKKLKSVSYTHLRAHETRGNLVCRLLLEKKGGLDDFLVSTPNSKLPEKAKKLKKTILSKIN